MAAGQRGVERPVKDGRRLGAACGMPRAVCVPHLPAAPTSIKCANHACLPHPTHLADIQVGSLHFKHRRRLGQQAVQGGQLVGAHPHAGADVLQHQHLVERENVGEVRCCQCGSLVTAIA